MPRSYKGVHLKKHRVYTVDDLQEAYGVTANTVSNWVKAGLRPSDDQRPYVFRGETVIQFHDTRRQRTRKQLRPGEFKCRVCALAVFPLEFGTYGSPTKSGAPMLVGACPDCSALCFKVGSQADLALLEQSTNPNIPEDCLHEGKHQDPGDIWISGENLPSENDRIICTWQSYAGKHSEKTIDRHLAAIRNLEVAVNGKPFDRLTCKDVGGFRDRLKAQLAARGDQQKSKSTVSHTASHVKAFLEWLIKQQGYKRLPSDLPSYLELPKSAYAKAIQTKPKLYPSIEQATHLLGAMPERTLAEKRNRAIFALAFLGALRADTLISLRINHIDIDGRKIVQDSSASRTKNGKSLIIQWFDIPEAFANAVIEWVKYLEQRGFKPTDALFPDLKALQLGKITLTADRPPIEPMATTHAANYAFSEACKTHESKYTPHAAKHTIAAERDRRPLTSEQRKAWSENMGHENEQITDTYYGKLSDDRRFEVLEAIGSNAEIPDLANATVEHKAIMFDAFLEVMVQKLGNWSSCRR